jgi:phospholipase A-2-activating protein
MLFVCGVDISMNDISTGASRYRSTGSGGGGSNIEYADPFTGASRYRTSEQTHVPASTPAPVHGDPFTGASQPSVVSVPPPHTKSTPSGDPNILPVVCISSVYLSDDVID